MENIQLRIDIDAEERNKLKNKINLDNIIVILVNCIHSNRETYFLTGRKETIINKLEEIKANFKRLKYKIIEDTI